MMSDLVLVTNNSDCYARYHTRCDCRFDAGWDYGQVLYAARDLLHQDYLLLSHPLAGSLKPNQTPYRSLILGRRSLDGEASVFGLLLLERAIEVYHGFQRDRKTPAWPERERRDFRTIDLSLVTHTLERCLQFC